MSRQVEPPVAVATACGWIGLVAFLCFQEFVIETARRWETAWWFRIPLTVVFGLVLLIPALECFQEEMTVRRWAVSVAVFGVFGALLVAAGIVNPEMLHLSRWVLLPAGVLYLGMAAVAGAGARDAA